MLPIEKVKDYARTSLWILPLAFVLASLVLAQTSLALDDALSGRALRFAFPGDVSTARSMLSTIATSMISFTGIVFTLTIVALQLASQQFSPRILRTFLADRRTQFALGSFVATFSYALLVLRHLGDSGTKVPNLSLSVAVVLVLASVVGFVGFLDHMAKSVRVSLIIFGLGDETRETIARQYPLEDPAVPASLPDGEPDVVVLAQRPGTLTQIHRAELGDLAAERGCVIHVLPRVGDFLVTGTPVAHIYGHGDIDNDELLRRLDLAQERTMEQDVAFGFRQLVDIAEKAVSPAINDPTTTVQAMDQLHDLLGMLATRPLPALRAHAGGSLVTTEVTFGDYVKLALTEIRHFADDYMQLVRRANALLNDLAARVPPERCPVLEEEHELWRRVIERSFPDAPDRALASEGDEQGIG